MTLPQRHRIEVDAVYTDQYGHFYRVVKLSGRGRHRKVHLNRRPFGTARTWMRVRHFRALFTRESKA